MIHIEKEKDSSLVSVSIPAKFFTDDMPYLDEDSLRAFLYIQAFVAQGQEELQEADILADLQLEAEQLANIFKLLEMRGLIAWNASGFRLTDLEALYRSDRQRSVQKVPGEHPREEILSNLIEQINSTFYQGVMSFSFYNSVEKWFYEYNFEPPLIYALFNELQHYDKLSVNAYAERIASNWHQKGIRSFADLSRFHEKNSELNRVANILQRKLRLNQPFSAYQMVYLKRWLEEWQLPFELIDEAFRKASLKQSHGNFNYVEGILKNWYEAEIQSLQELEDFESARQEQFAEQRRTRSSASAKPGFAMGNFQERQYSEEEIEELNRSLDFLDEEVGVEFP